MEGKDRIIISALVFLVELFVIILMFSMLIEIKTNTKTIIEMLTPPDDKKTYVVVCPKNVPPFICSTQEEESVLLNIPPVKGINLIKCN